MKLFRYLIIDDDVVKKLLIPLNPKEEPEYYLENPKQNRIYTYNGYPKIAFMSFRYHNVIVTKGLDDKTYNPVWAYVIIDNDEKIKRVIRRHKNWSTDKDSNKKRITSETTIKQMDTINGVEYDIEPLYKKLSGHLGVGNEGKRVYTLHEKILQENQEIKVRYIEFPNRTNNEGKKVRHKIYAYGWPETIVERIHHKGHTFDNRMKYLAPLEKKGHDIVHAWEVQHNFLRPKKIDFLRTEGINFEGSYSKCLECDCGDNYNCLECSAVLRIDTEQEFSLFMEQLHSTEYRELERKTIYYDALKNIKK